MSRPQAKPAAWFPKPVRPPKPPPAPEWPKAVLPPPPLEPIKARRMPAPKAPRLPHLPVYVPVPFALPARAMLRSPLPGRATLPAAPAPVPRPLLPAASPLPSKVARPGPVWPVGAYLWARITRIRRSLAASLATERGLQKVRA